MKSHGHPAKRLSSRGPDRRKSQRFDLSFDVQVRFLPDGTPIKATGTELGPNGLRLLTSIPLGEASYIHVSFDTASNNTHCEGRVVWTKRSGAKYESGIDIQKWGGDVPGTEFIHKAPFLPPKKDRRKKLR